MAWVDLDSNQTVSFNNLQNAVDIGYFQALATIPASNEQITKADASSLVSIDTSFASYAAKASNQLVVRSNLKPVFQYSDNFYYNFDYKGWFGWSSSSNACPNYSSASSVTVNWNGTLANGTVVFIPNGTLDLSTTGYYIIVYSGTAYWMTFSGSYYDATTGTYGFTINSIGTCIFSDSWSVRTESGSTPINICTNTPFTVYSALGASFTSGTALFTDAALTNSLVIGGSPNSYISEVLSGTIFEYNDGLGQIGTNTGLIC